MPGKVVRTGRLNGTHLLHIVRCEFTHLCLMLVDVRRKLETIHGLFPAQFCREFDKGQQASSDSVGNEQWRTVYAGL